MLDHMPVEIINIPAEPIWNMYVSTPLSGKVKNGRFTPDYMET